MRQSVKMTNNFFFLVFQEVFLSISGFRNLRCWKCHEPKKWISKKIGRFTSKLSLDSATPLDPLTQAPEDFASSKQCHGSGLPVAVLVFWFQVLWAEKFQKNVKISLKFGDNLVGWTPGDSKSNFLSYFLMCLSQRYDDALVLTAVVPSFFTLSLILVTLSEPEISTIFFVSVN